MKRLFLFVLSFCFVLCLTGCEVHYNGETMDVSWYVIAIPVALFSLLCILIAGLGSSVKRFVCPKCHNTFRPNRWKMVFSPHIAEEHLMRCPHCKTKQMCYPSYDQE